MGDLLVWINGVENTISGVNTSTTTREVAVALAQSYRLIGCFNLLEKTPGGERCLHPNEHPFKLSQKWGQNFPSYFILRKKSMSPTSSRPSSSNSQSSPVRNRLVEVALLSGLSSGATTNSSSKKKGKGPPIVKPKPKRKPMLETSKTEEIKPIPVPRKSILVSPSSVQEEVFQQSQQHQQQQIYQQPDILIKSQLPASHSSENSKPSCPSEQKDDADDHSKPREDNGELSAEEERRKKNQERLNALERQRQQQEQVEKALKEKRNRKNRSKRQNSGDQKRTDETDGQRELKQPGRPEEEDKSKTTDVETPVEVEQLNEVQSVRTRPQDDEIRRQRDATKLRELEDAKRLDNERKQKEGRERAILEQKRKEKLDRQKELDKKKEREAEEKKRKESEDRKQQEQERVQSLKLKQLAEQKEKERQELKKKELERKRRQEEEEKAKLLEAKQRAEWKRQEERKKALEEEEKQKLADLVKAQECKLNHQQSQLTGLDTAIQALIKFENDPAIDRIREEIANIERSIQTNHALLNERDFWDNELELERQMHKKLEASVGDLKDKVADCNRQISKQQAEIVSLTKTIKKEEKKVTLDQDQAEEVKAVKEELRELKHEYVVITANLVKVSDKLTGLDDDFQEKQKELKLVEEDYGREKTKELHIIIPDNRIESKDGKEQGSASPSLHRILKGSPRQLAVATPSTDNPEGIFL